MATEPEEQPAEPERKPRHLAELDDPDSRPRARGHLLTLLSALFGRS